MNTPQTFRKEAQDMINYFGGFVPKERNWKEESIQFFKDNKIDEIHWDTIYYEALLLENN